MSGNLSIWIGFAKFFLGTFVLGLTAAFINRQIQNREIELKEIDRLGKFIEHALEENVGVRRRFSQYFSTVTRSEKLRERWKEYNEIVELEYHTKIKEKEKNIELEKQLEKSQNKGNEVGDELRKVRKQIVLLENELRARKPEKFDYEDSKTKVTVHLYWHEKGFTYKEALSLKEELYKNGLRTFLMEHRDPKAPDSIFIGSLVNSVDARLVLSKLPYKIQYIFPLDYPSGQGGDLDGLLIGVGYMSGHYQEYRTKEAAPIKINDSDVASLLEANLSNTEFQKRLRKITKF